MENDRGRTSRPTGCRVRPLRVALAVLLVAPSAWAAAPEDSPDRVEPTFSALMIDGRTANGRIVAFSDGGVTIAARDGKREVLPLDRLVKLTRESPGQVATGEGAQAVFLAEGDRLMRTTIGTATDAGIEVRSEAMGKIELPVDGVLGLVLAGPEVPRTPGILANRILHEGRKSEVVWLSNGDRLDGSFLGMDERTVRLQVDGKPLEVDRGGALAVGFDPALIHYDRPKGAFLEAALDDGTRLGLTSLKLADGTVEATTRFGKSVRFPLAVVTRFRARSRSVVYLSERPTAAAQYDSYVGPTRAHRIDETVEGQPIRLGGQVYDRGIGAESRTLLAYRLEPGDRHFQALIGVDERAGALGNVVFRVLVDRRERYKSPPLTGATHRYRSTSTSPTARS